MLFIWFVKFVNWVLMLERSVEMVKLSPCFIDDELLLPLLL